VKLLEVELRRVELPLVAPFRTSFGTETARDVLLVKVTTPDGQGWGECVAPATPTYSAEHVDGAEQVLTRFLVPALLARADVTAEDVADALAFVKGNRMAKAAIEMAILDAQLRARGDSFATYLGGVRDVVDAGVSVGIMDTIPELVDAVGAYLEQGYQRVKLKIEPGWDIEPARAVRERFGEDLMLQVDANAAYTLDDASHLAQLDAFDLLLIEQPLAADDMAGHAELARRIRTPVCLDESIESAKDAVDAIATGACAIVNIKAGRVGGYLEARRVHDLCAARGVPVWCGGMLETGIGRAANLALASLPGFTLPGDLSASGRYFHQDVTAPFELEAGQVRVPTGPGLGVEPIAAVLDDLTRSVHTITPT
jgi:O-succinylbenzoate synthase